MSKQVATRRNDIEPFRFLQNGINDLFADLWGNSAGTLVEEFSPQADITETEKEITVKLDLAGVEEKDVSVELSEGVLTIRGEKRAEREERNKTYHLTERSSGSFVRAFGMPATIDDKKVSATFDKGELTVTLPKSAQARETTRKIAVTSKR